MQSNISLSKETVSRIDLMIHQLKQLLQEMKLNDFHGVQEKLSVFSSDLEKVKNACSIFAEEDVIFLQIQEKLLVNLTYSLEVVCELAKKESPFCEEKLEFELLPFARVLYLAVYYCCSVKGDPEKEQYFQQEEFEPLLLNHYISNSEATGNYKYDVSISVQAYNQLEYTKKCVESILKTIPDHLSYELILINHGSSDGTKEYFESICPTKQLDYKENDLLFSIFANQMIPEGKYRLSITNDIILCKNSIENLLTCIKADESHKYVVPMTTNMLNCQEPQLPEGVETIPEILSWAEGNNVSNPYLWEQRVILFNPVTMIRSADLFGEQAYRTPFFLRFSGGSDGNDSILSALVRRSGNKCILAKDAFCYHHDHITRKQSKNYDDKKYWGNKIKDMDKSINIKHYSTGRCYSISLMKQLQFPHQSHVEVLGLNCGLASDPLKIKESYKEYQHNLDCYVTNVQDTPEYHLDVPSVSDSYCLIHQFEEVLDKLKEKKYQWIIYEDKFSFSFEEETLYKAMKEALTEDGVIILGQPTQLGKTYFSPHQLVEYYHREELNQFLIYKN